jgi:hypothetical protein
MPGKNQHKGIFHTKVNELSVYQLIDKPHYSRVGGGTITKIRDGSTSFNIYRGGTKLKSFNKIKDAIKFAGNYKFEMSNKKKRKLGLIK